MDKHFFDAVRPMFGKLSQGQVDGMVKIIEYGQARGVSRLWMAYIMATIYHETAKWMQPIREGARRYGPDYSDASARRAVKAIFDKGIIRTNYALPAGPYKKSYYGRGLVQITWYENYAKFGVAKNPDAALDWDKALEITFDGMLKGMFRRNKSGPISLNIIRSTDDFTRARNIINGDVRKNGGQIAKEAMVFYKALKTYTPGKVSRAPKTSPRPTARPNKSENSDDKPRRRAAPAWWPFQPRR